MKGPEDDSGLAGKVAILSGGGAVGDGIGNGRAAAILLARAGTKVLVADLDLDEILEVRKVWQFFRDRRPESYGVLTSQSGKASGD